MTDPLIRLDDFDDRLQSAVEQFWASRSRQGKAQGKGRGRGARDRGGRASVTGGAHVDALIHLIRDLLVENAVPESAVFVNRRTVDLPLYFRPHRDWDMVVVHDDRLLACLEAKSQVGPSFGNNYNNRAQEAVGDAVDMAVAYREGLFSPSPRPWIGYVMLLEKTEGSTTPVGVRESHFKVDPAFRGASYARRYESTILRLVRESLYDAAALVLTSKGPPATCSAPNPEVDLRRLVISLIGHTRAMLSL